MKTFLKSRLTAGNSGYILNVEDEQRRFFDSLSENLISIGNLYSRVASSIEKSPNLSKPGIAASELTISLWPFSLALLGSAFGDAVYGAQVENGLFIFKP